MSKIKAVIFDMDGVLIDAKEWHYDALNRALSLFGYAISRYDHLVTFDGLPTRRKLEMLTREKALPIGLHKLINELKQIYTMELIHANCKPVFNHEYALSRLKSRGLVVGLASNSIRKTIETMMQYASLEKYLDFMLSNEDVTNGKPDPEIYIKAIKMAGVFPSECLIVEDNEHGIVSAKKSGAHIMVVKNVHEVTIQNIDFHIESIEGKL
jgi:beta-phosphoglucomutase